MYLFAFDSFSFQMMITMIDRRSHGKERDWLTRMLVDRLLYAWRDRRPALWWIFDESDVDGKVGSGAEGCCCYGRAFVSRFLYIPPCLSPLPHPFLTSPSRPLLRQILTLFGPDDEEPAISHAGELYLRLRLPRKQHPSSIRRHEQQQCQGRAVDLLRGLVCGLLGRMD